MLLRSLPLALVLLLACVVPRAEAVRIDLLQQGIIEANAASGAADGSVWMLGAANSAIGHINAAGTAYIPGGFNFAYPGLTPNALVWHDGAIWVTRGGVVEKYAPGGTLIPIEATSGASVLTPAADGSMWFIRAAANQIGRVTPDGKVKLFGGITSGALVSTWPRGVNLTFGPDGNVWFTEPAIGMIGRLTPQGTVTEFPLPAGTTIARGIAAGRDGHLYVGLAGAIGRVTTAGVLVARLNGDRTDIDPGSLTTGPDGSLWWTQGMHVWRMRLPAGRVEPYSVLQNPVGSVMPLGLARGADGTLWFYEWWGGRPGRIVFDPPRAATAEAAILEDGRVRLSGAAAGRGVDTTVVFEYGATAGYGATTDAQPVADSDDSAPVSATTAPLAPGTYHYRVVATNLIGRTAGEDRAFVVPAPPEVPTPTPPVVIGLPDGDGDGFPAGVDCNDRDPAVHPGAVDRPQNKVDEDCAGGDARYTRFEPLIEASWNTSKRYVVFNRLTIDYLPPAATLRLTCVGKGCKIKSYKASISREVRGLDLLKRLKKSRLERKAVVELQLSRPGYITTITRWTVGPPAKRSVRCLPPGATKATKCV